MGQASKRGKASVTLIIPAGLGSWPRNTLIGGRVRPLRAALIGALMCALTSAAPRLAAGTPSTGLGTPCGPNWEIVSSPSPGNGANSLAAVSALSATEADLVQVALRPALDVARVLPMVALEVGDHFTLARLVGGAGTPRTCQRCNRFPKPCVAGLIPAGGTIDRAVATARDPCGRREEGSARPKRWRWLGPRKCSARNRCE